MEGWLSGEATDERVHLLMRVRIPHLPQRLHRSLKCERHRECEQNGLKWQSHEAAEAQVASGRGYRPPSERQSSRKMGLVDHPEDICNDADGGCKPAVRNQSTEY